MHSYYVVIVCLICVLVAVLIKHLVLVVTECYRQSLIMFYVRISSFKINILMYFQDFQNLE